MKKRKEECTLPGLYQSCGEEDFLFTMNQDVNQKIEEMGVPCEYHEVPGHMHNWDFWDMTIQRVLDWLPLEEGAQGINSGNVKERDE